MIASDYRAPKISVVVPVFNIEKELAACLESIVQQSFADFEVVVVNDGSTDGSRDIVATYQARDNRFVVIEKKNEGLARARQDGWNLASGEYIFHLDGDDYLPHDALELLYREALSADADIVVGNFTKISETSRIDIKVRVPADHSATRFLHVMFVQNNFYMWGKLMRKSLYLPEPIVYADIAYGEDTVVLPQLAIRAAEISYVTESVYFYRVRESSLSNRPSRKAIESRLRATDIACSYVRSNVVDTSLLKDVDYFYLWQIYRHVVSGGRTTGNLGALIKKEIRKSFHGMVAQKIKEKSVKMYAILLSLRFLSPAVRILVYLKFRAGG